jgi:hypothetical protein
MTRSLEERLATLENHREMRDKDWDALVASNRRQEEMLKQLTQQWALATFPLAMVKYMSGVAGGLLLIWSWLKYGPK